MERFHVLKCGKVRDQVIFALSVHYFRNEFSGTLEKHLFLGWKKSNPSPLSENLSPVFLKNN